jgi:hypothetical protein
MEECCQKCPADINRKNRKPTVFYLASEILQYKGGREAMFNMNHFDTKN